MTPSARYLKVVMWSEEDQLYVGQCPGIVGSCCHGDDEVEVYRQLCAIVDDEIDRIQRKGKPLPPATAKTDNADDVIVRVEDASTAAISNIA